MRNLFKFTLATSASCSKSRPRTVTAAQLRCFITKGLSSSLRGRISRNRTRKLQSSGTLESAQFFAARFSKRFTALSAPVTALPAPAAVARPMLRSY